ncbi:MAG: tRNA-dihydrouridine synthase, partial [Pseudomonadota bacterium]|nr:tRNA-dihydrouridine synthase [Pseudomonadota bacterium]
YDELAGFVAASAAAGCRTFIIHARKAWLQGLSPKENREIPPLRYEVVYRLKQDFPDLEIILNGGIASLEAVEEHLDRVDGVMLGRAAYHNPYLLAGVDRRFFAAAAPPLTRRQVVERFLPYVQRQLDRGVPLTAMTRPLLGLFQGRPGARAWRRQLSDNAHRRGAGVGVIEAALTRVPEDEDSPTPAYSA